MKSSTGVYFVALDHARALAVFLVFSWHFNSINQGQYAPPFTFIPSIFTEGHTGVAVFMTLSGYLFAKILEGKDVDYLRFVWNRCIRLLPLLALVLIIVGMEYYFRDVNLRWYVKGVLMGIVYPTLPHGGWSITVECHFYLVLPVILWLARKNKAWLFGVLLVALIARVIFYAKFGTVQIPAYWTILGRLDNFLLGIAVYYYRHLMTRRHVLTLVIAVSFLFFYRWFDVRGGFYKFEAFPSPSPIWIIMPTIEGFVYSTIIAWYDTSFQHSRGAISSFIARIGESSYSIYLLHYFFVYEMAIFISRYVHLDSSVPRALATIVCFLLIVPIAILSYRFIETPFLKYRVRYIKEPLQPSAAATPSRSSPDTE